MCFTAEQSHVAFSSFQSFALFPPQGRLCEPDYMCMQKILSNGATTSIFSDLRSSENMAKNSENAQPSEGAQNCAFMLKDDLNCGAFLHLMV